MVIPEGWQEAYLASISDIKTGPFGSSLHANDYQTSGIPIITVEHLGETCVSHANLPRVGTDDYKRLANYTLQEGDIVFSRVGSVDRNALVRRTEHGWLFSGRLLRIRVKSRDCHPAYLSYYFHYEPVKQRIRNISVGQTMASLNTKLLSLFTVYTPPLSEQKAIAEALSDMDNLITATEKLLAKKKAIKQGAMQELLTGKRRLPGFSAEWQLCNIGDTLTLGHGCSQKSVEDNGGQYPILATGGCIGRTNSFLWDKPSVLIGRKGTINKPQYVDKPFWTIDTLFYSKIKKGYCAKYLYYSFCMINWMDYNEASGVPSLSANTIANIEITIPCYREQVAIAIALSRIDMEIDKLQHKLNKYRQIKQGMMSELLTGRIRLV